MKPDHFRLNALTFDNVRHLEETMSSNMDVRSMCCVSWHGKDEIFLALLAILPKFACLNELHLPYLPSLTIVPKLAEYLAFTTQINVLMVSWIDFSDTGLTQLSGALARNTSIKKLHLTRGKRLRKCAVSDGFAALGRALAQNTSLTYLSIKEGFTLVQPGPHAIISSYLSDVHAIYEPLSAITTLTYLAFKEVNISAPCLRCIVRILKESKLQRLVIKDANFYHERERDEKSVIEEFARVLGTNTELTSLEISRTDLDFTDACHLFDGLSVNKHVRYVSFAHHGFWSDVYRYSRPASQMESIVRFFETNSTIRTLHMTVRPENAECPPMTLEILRGLSLNRGILDFYLGHFIYDFKKSDEGALHVRVDTPGFVNVSDLIASVDAACFEAHDQELALEAAAVDMSRKNMVLQFFGGRFSPRFNIDAELRRNKEASVYLNHRSVTWESMDARMRTICLGCVTCLPYDVTNELLTCIGYAYKINKDL